MNDAQDPALAAGKAVVEAVLFSALGPVPENELAAGLPDGIELRDVLSALSFDYDGRGLGLARTRRGIAIRTRAETSDLANQVVPPPPRLTRAAFETVALIACFDAAGIPVTRSEIQRVRDVSQSPGILDALLSAGYIKPGRRRDTPGRPLTWTVTEDFYDAFDLRSLSDIEPFAAMLADGLAVLPPLERAEAEADETEGGSP